MFFYKIYGKRVMTNIELPLLYDVTDSNEFDLKVHVDFDVITGDKISIKEEFDRYVIKLGSLASYCIDPINNIITCKAQNFESFFSTFFNIPFSVYCLCKDELLYHACSLIYDNKVFCLTGNKGVGKSTVMQLLSTKSEFKIFSDDTIHINSDFICSRAHNLVKHTPETVEALKLNTLNVKNAAGKYYSSFEVASSFSKINKIFHLVRTDKKEFDLRPINSSIMKKSIFRTNIVGITHMTHSLITKAMKLNPDPDIEFYELSVPNNLDHLINNSDKLEKMVINCFEISV